MISEINTKHCVSDWQTFCEYQMYLTNLYALMFFLLSVHYGAEKLILSNVIMIAGVLMQIAAVLFYATTLFFS